MILWNSENVDARFTSLADEGILRWRGSVRPMKIEALGRGIVLSMVSIAAGAGCGGSALETGYKPRILSASEAQRRAYYASPFSKEAALAEKDRASNSTPDYRTRRPGAYQ